VQGAARRTGWFPEQAVQRRNAPFPHEPGGQPREPAACGVAAPCRSPATSRRRALHAAGSRGCAIGKKMLDRFYLRYPPTRAMRICTIAPSCKARYESAVVPALATLPDFSLHPERIDTSGNLFCINSLTTLQNTGKQPQNSLSIRPIHRRKTLLHMLLVDSIQPSLDTIGIRHTCTRSSVLPESQFGVRE
jgi:hypothetical protein